MFNGIIREVGQVKNFYRSGNVYVLHLSSHLLSREMRVGDSLSVDGVCLTITEKGNAELYMNVVEETLRRTNFSRLKPGKRVNLEPPLRAGEFVSGHFIYGHIDTTLRVIGWKDAEMWVELPSEWSPYIVQKGAVALNGVSLTVAHKKPGSFSVALIPYTLEHTNLSDFREGDLLNLEIDPFARYLIQVQR
ncbi:MAG: riboflavin synthase [bacterium JZ-2024 1]